MRSQTYRLVRAIVVVGFLLLAARHAFAQTDLHTLASESLTHCQSARSACEAQVPALANNIYCKKIETGGVGPACPAGPNIGRYRLHRVDTDSSLSDSQCSGIIEGHAYCEDPPPPVPCEDGLTINSASWFQQSDPNNLCDGSCKWQECSGVTVCLGGGCLGTICSTGEECDWSDNVENAPPQGCQMQSGTVVCDCVANPGAWFCSATSGEQCTTTNQGITTCYPANEPAPPHDEGPPGSDQQPGGNDTPPGSNDPGGVGQHQDGDGTGTTTSSGDCEEIPACDGGAVECAILTQVWRSNCSLQDTKGEKPPWQDDPDWGRDLKAEAQRVSLEGEIESSGPSGSCPENPSMSVFGVNLELDISMACTMAGIIRVFVLLAAWLTAAFIVARNF